MLFRSLTLTDYEKLKAANIRRNNEKLEELKLPTIVTGMVDAMKKKTGKKKQQDKDAYVPENEEESTDDESEIKLKVRSDIDQFFPMYDQYNDKIHYNSIYFSEKPEIEEKQACYWSNYSLAS